MPSRRNSVKLDRRPTIAVLSVHYLRQGGRSYHGGAEKYLRNCVRGLLAAGANVHVNLSGDSIYDDLPTGPNGPVLHVERTDWVDPDLGTDRRLGPSLIRRRMAWFRRVRPDAVFAVYPYAGAFGASIVAARLCGVPVVSSMRQMAHPLPAASGKRWLGVIRSPELWRRRLRWRLRIPACCTAVILFNSRRVLDEYVQLYGFPAGRCRVIPNGVVCAPQPRSRCEPDARHFINNGRSGRLMFGTVAKLSPHKGPDTTLEAFARLAAERDDVGLIYWGDGPLAPALRERVRSLGLGSRVHLAGYCDDRDRAFDNIDVFVLPSHREGMPNAVLEAMARGLPCIVSDVGGQTELIEHGLHGLVVPPRRPDALLEAMRTLAGSAALRTRLGDAGYERAGREFDEARRIRDNVEVILQAAGRPSRRSIAETRRPDCVECPLKQADATA